MYISKNKLLIIMLFILIAFTLSCKKVNILRPSHIPPPTEFPKDDTKPEIPDYPIPSPLPPPPDKPEDQYIEIKPEIVQGRKVFGGYGRRIKLHNEWYVIATNEYQYDNNSKRLTPTGKGALLKINNDGSTIIKIHSMLLGDDLEKSEYWTNLNSKKLIVESDRVLMPSKVVQELKYFPTYPRRLDTANFYVSNPPPYYRFGCYEQLIIHIKNRESDSLINWKDSADEIKKTNYYIPFPDDNDVGVQGVHGYDTLDFSSVFYINGKLMLFGQKSFVDDNKFGRRSPSEPKYTDDSNVYYTVDINKDTTDNKSWIKHEFPFPQKRQQFKILYDEKKLDKVYVYGGLSSHFDYDSGRGLWVWQIDTQYTEKDGVWSTADGINWKEEKNVNINNLSQYYYYPNISRTYAIGKYEMEDGTPFEPSYAELNGKYYRTLKSTYPIPPIREIMEKVDRFETNFTITEEHIKKSGAYQLQVSSVHPDKAKESDWINVVPNNEITLHISWASGGSDLFNFNNKLVRLADYDRVFQIDTQYETALKLSQQYYNLLVSSPISDFKKYNYYFLYYKAMADMLKMIKDKGNNYFMPDEALTHYTFELN